MENQDQQSPVPVVPTQTVPSQNLPKQSSYGKRNWWKWGFIYLVLAIVIYGGVYYFVLSKQSSSPYLSKYPTPTPAKSSEPTPPPDPTTNWKTHTNSTYGYEIKYPKDWFIKDMTKDSIDTFHTSTVLSSIYLNDTNEIDFSKYKVVLTVDSSTIDDLKTLLNNFSSENKKVLFSESQLNGRNISKVTITFSQQVPNSNKPIVEDEIYVVLIPLNQYTLSLRSNLKLKPTLDQILSTFRFSVS